jgi:hypothetical protein
MIFLSLVFLWLDRLGLWEEEYWVLGIMIYRCSEKPDRLLDTVVDHLTIVPT